MPLLLVLVLAFLLGAAALTVFVLRPVVTVVPDEIPADFPSDGFSHATFEGLLETYVTPDGGMDYERFSANSTDRAKLARYLGAVARYSPDNSPARFASENDRTAYWMYAYNALVIYAVLERWPLESVTDVKAPIEVVRGLGFFYKLKFIVGGECLSLYEIEHKKVLKRAKDPRVHFVLNCGSGGCPVMRPELPTGDDLEPFLQQAAEDFVGSERNVLIDHEKKTVYVSKIFDWYEDDFLMEVRRRGTPGRNDLVAYLSLVAPARMKPDLSQAKSYSVTVRDYDWSVNQGEGTH